MKASLKASYQKALIIPLIILSLLFLSACDSDSSPTTGTGGVFKGGSLGVEARFEPIGVIQEDGSQSIYDTDEFSIEILLNNQGEEDIQIGGVTLNLIGQPKEDFQNIPAWSINNKNLVDKISEFNPQGGEEIVSFTPDNLAKYTKPVTVFTPLKWNVEYIYDYKTHLVMNDVCFKGDFNDKKICNVQEPKTYSVSGAPISVTGVEQDTAGKGVIQLKITIENVGDGKATAPGMEFDNRFSQVGYAIDEPNLWRCKSGGRESVAIFVGTTAQVVCKLKTALAPGDLYTKVVPFTISYKYKDLIEQTVLVKETVE